MVSPLYTSIVNKTDYLILEVLATRDLNTPFFSAKIEQLMQYTSLSKTKVRNALRVFIMMGLVNEGNKDHRSKTYYITGRGEDHYMAVFGLTLEDLNKLKDEFQNSQETAQTECSISADVTDTNIVDVDTIDNENTTNKEE